MSFSMLSGKRTLLVIVTGVMLAVLAGMLLLRKMPRLERAAWILVVGGGVGNQHKRLRRPGQCSAAKCPDKNSGAKA